MILLLKLISLLIGVAFTYVAAIMICQPRDSGQDWNPFDALIGLLFLCPSLLLIFSSFQDWSTP